ncbi:hypothetical protein ACXZ66_11955 [Corynebacterium sp. S7]
MTQSPQRHHRLPQKYYIRRRVAALLIILVVVALIIWGLVAWGRSSQDQTNQAASEATSTAPETPTSAPETTQPSSSEAPTPTSSAETSTTDTAAKGTCDIKDLRITASTDKPSYKANEQPTMYMKVENPTDSDCKITLADDTLRFEVYALDSNRRVWADTDCYASVISGEEVFPANGARNFQAVWSRAGSAPGQCSDRTPVPEGSYFLHGVIGNNASDAAPFNLAT